MKSLRSFVSAAGLLMVNLSGCVLDASEPDALDDTPMTERLAYPGYEIEPPAGVCNPLVHIARRNQGGDCPFVEPNWKGESVFDLGTPWLIADDEEVPVGLAPYCEYTWDDTVLPSLEDVEALYDAPALLAVSPSCLGVTGQADLLTATLASLLRDAFHVNTGRPTMSDLGGPVMNTVTPEVTVMVIDSQPEDFVVPTSRHGLHMGNIISDIACASDMTNCRVEIEFAVGLPRIGGGAADYTNGGIVAYHKDLAAGIYEGVRRWEVANENRPPTNLVMNLSVGWEGMVFGGEEVDPPPALEAVRTALEYASCKQAIIVASAGNRGEFCDVSGPMLPAAWEAYPAPDDVRCAELGVTIPPPPPLGYRPLVHGVGGLDINGEMMPRAREGATPRLMAASAHAAAGDPIRAGLTGTSVGTAAVAGAAALVWSFRPHLAPHQVMQWVYAGGEALGPEIDTDFGLDPNTLDAPHRVDACSALDAACNGIFANCPAMPLGCSSVALPTRQDILDELAPLTVGQSITPSLPDIDTTCLNACGSPVSINVESGANASCEIFDVDPAEHLINPTPDSIACPTCGIQDNLVSVTLDPAFEDNEIINVQVVVSDDMGNTSRFELGAQEFSSDQLTIITLPAAEMPSGIVREADIIIDFEERRTTIDSLLIL